MRSSPQLISMCVVLAACLLPGQSGQTAPDLPFPDAYRADALAPVRGEAPREVQLLVADASRPLPPGLAAEIEERVRREWPEAQVYGPVHSSLGVWLRYPLVTARVSGRLLVPLIDGTALSLAGVLETAREPAARRVVVLVDASASANALSLPASAGERSSVLAAEWRALDRLVGLLEPDDLEIGLIAFGEATWPIAEPGLDSAEIRRRLGAFRREHPRGQGRNDAVCALWTAHDWLESAPAGVEREVIVLTDGDLPHSGRFTPCDAAPARQLAGGRQACEKRRNRAICPARQPLPHTQGTSDLAQLALFSRRTRGRLRITPLVFDLERSARVWEQLARRSGSSLVRVPAPGAIEQVLPALVSSRIRAVHVHNSTTGQTSADLLEPDGRRFSGSLALRPGANDVELQIDADGGGLAALFRFRVYSWPGSLEGQLTQGGGAAPAAVLKALQLRGR